MMNKLLNDAYNYVNKEEEHVTFRMNLILGLFMLALIVITAVGSLLLAKCIFYCGALRFAWVSILFDYPILYMVLLFMMSFGIYLFIEKIFDAWGMDDDEYDEDDE